MMLKTSAVALPQAISQRLLTGIALLGMMAMVTGCIHPRGGSVQTAPPLEVPEPPQRAFSPVEEPLPAAALVPDTPVPAITPATPRPPAPRRAGRTQRGDCGPRGGLLRAPFR